MGRTYTQLSEEERAALRKRLDEAKVKPVVNEPNRKLYRLDECEAALQQENELDAVKLHETMAHPITVGEEMEEEPV